jgi:S1-C subfamily serine protease
MGMLRLTLILLVLLGFAAPACADDVSAAARGVVRVVVVANEDGEVADFSHGSGFAVAPNRIVTNAHVVALAREYPDSYQIGVVPSEGDQSYAARIVTIDPARDLALLEVVEGAITPIPLFMGPVTEGADVVALGYPGNVDAATAQSAADFIRPASPTRSTGNFSNERLISGSHALLHTANVARGHSGGPLVDPCGRVIGVNSFITSGEDGDAPFAFAIANRELAAFLRGAGQPYAAISSECVSMADRLRQDSEHQGREDEAARRAREKAQREAEAKAAAANQDARENYTAVALLLGVLGLAGLGGAGLMLLKDRQRPGYILGGLGLVFVLGSAAAFLSRPSRSELDSPAAPATAPSGSLQGTYLCRFADDRSRITVSSAEDVVLRWSEGGCVNGRTQYAQTGDAWHRILVPNDEATVSVAEFRPAAGDYVVTRYLLGAAAMKQVRDLRSQIELKSCTADDEALALLADRQETIRSSLPRVPNERLVYDCSRSGTP